MPIGAKREDKDAANWPPASWRPAAQAGCRSIGPTVLSRAACPHIRGGSGQMSGL